MYIIELKKNGQKAYYRNNGQGVLAMDGATTYQTRERAIITYDLISKNGDKMSQPLTDPIIRQVKLTLV